MNIKIEIRSTRFSQMTENEFLDVSKIKLFRFLENIFTVLTELCLSRPAKIETRYGIPVFLAGDSK